MSAWQRFVDLLRKYPRLDGFLWFIGGTAGTLLMAWLIGGATRVGTKAIAVVGSMGIVAGYGLGMLIWPAAAAAETEDNGNWSRASLLQKILYCLLATVGVIAVATLITVFSGKY